MAPIHNPSIVPAPREAYVAAAKRLLTQGSTAAALQPAALDEAAGQPAGTLADIYPDPADFQLALFSHLLDEARSAATEAVASQGADVLGLKRGLEAYLDSHLRQPALRELTLLLRERPEAQALINRRIAGFHRVLQVGFSSLRALYPLASAQLVTAMMIDISQAEYEARKPLPELRETLYAYVDRVLP